LSDSRLVQRDVALIGYGVQKVSLIHHTGSTSCRFSAFSASIACATSA
jgi:hypothetical protein